MNCGVPYGEIGIHEYVEIQAHYIVILYRFTLTCRVVKNHSLSSITVQNIASIKRSVLHYRMMFVFGIAL